MVAWWKSRSASAQEQGEKRETQYRKKTYEWLLSVDYMLTTLGFKGLKTFTYGRAEVEDPAKIPHMQVLTLVLDQGNDGWGACWFLALSLFTNILVINDVSHPLWNDVCGALRAVGIWSVVALLLVVLGFEHGPWKDAKWLQSCREVSRTLDHTMDWKKIPHFQELLPRVAVV